MYTLSFDYKQKIHDDQYPFKIEDANANFYTFSLAGGIRKQLKKLNAYAYAGPGLGFLTEPRVKVDAINNIAKIENDRKFSFPVN